MGAASLVAASSVTASQRVAAVDQYAGHVAGPIDGYLAAYNEFPEPEPRMDLRRARGAGLFVRDGRNYLMTVGHTATLKGWYVHDYGRWETLGRVSHTTYRLKNGQWSDEPPRIALVDTQRTDIAPLVRIAPGEKNITIDTENGPVTLPPVAPVSRVATPDSARRGGTVCFSKLDGAYSYRCGEIVTWNPCQQDLGCLMTSKDGSALVAGGDSGSYVWRPLADGTVEFQGILDRSLAGDGFYQPAWRFTETDWKPDQTAPGHPTGKGGRIVTVPSPPNDLAVSTERGKTRISWSPSTEDAADPVTGYQVFRGSRKIAELGREARSFEDPKGDIAAPTDFRVVAVDKWGVQRTARLTDQARGSTYTTSPERYVDGYGEPAGCDDAARGCGLLTNGAWDPNSTEDTGKEPSPFHGGWLGFHPWRTDQRGDIRISVDLGKPTRISTISSHWLRAEGTATYYPRTVRYEVSADGRTWKDAGTASPSGGDPSAAWLSIAVSSEQPVRHIRLTAEAQQAYFFTMADEIIAAG
ncbi:discoidin domain-containing protein [Streptomyces sp. NPDC001941]|uniref:discoidin domain-containing protein n=1 Tax=Streptomyces sp. NPDC001941 TaxID=3154659 RepID=UPI003323DB8A